MAATVAVAPTHCTHIEQTEDGGLVLAHGVAGHGALAQHGKTLEREVPHVDLPAVRAARGKGTNLWARYVPSCVAILT